MGIPVNHGRTPMVPASAANHPDLQLGGDLAVQFHIRLEAPEGLDRRIDENAAVGDFDALRGQLVRHHAGSDRAEKLIVLGGLHGDGDLGLGQFGGEGLGVLQFRGAAGGDLSLAGFDQPEDAGRGLGGELFGDQLVAGVSRSDLDFVAGQTEIFHIVHKNKRDISHDEQLLVR